MDPLTLSLILQSVAEGTQKGIGSAIQAGSTIDRLSPEQKTRMKQLERQQALGMLGMDKAQQQQILSQQLQPVQTSLREAMQAQAQQQQIGDIGQGSAFRGQQALLESASQARTRATQSAQEQISELDELAKARQLAELQQYKAQQQQNRKAIGQIASGLLAGGATAAAGISSAETAAGQIKLREEAMAAALQKMTKSAVEKAQKTPASDDFSQEYFDALGVKKAEEKLTQEELVNEKYAKLDGEIVPRSSLTPEQAQVAQPVYVDQGEATQPVSVDQGEAPIITGDTTAQAQQIVNPELFIDPSAQARRLPQLSEQGLQDLFNFTLNQSNQALSGIPSVQNVDFTGTGGFIPMMAGIRAGKPTVVGTPVRSREQAEAPAEIPFVPQPQQVITEKFPTEIFQKVPRWAGPGKTEVTRDPTTGQITRVVFIRSSDGQVWDTDRNMDLDKALIDLGNIEIK